jgi:hypothetical protein
MGRAAVRAKESVGHARASSLSVPPILRPAALARPLTPPLSSALQELFRCRFFGPVQYRQT